MRTVLLVPRRADDGPRDRSWAWCKARWQRYFPDVPIYEGHHTAGPFNRSAAINLAARIADAEEPWDLGIVIDADVFLKVSAVGQAIERAAETGKVTWPHRRWRGLSDYWTGRTLDDRRDFGPEIDQTDMDVLVERTNPISWSCCIVIPRAVWDDLGGFDERFRGWGFEDMAFQSIVAGLYGHERIDSDVYHLWHPRSEERITPGQPAFTATPEYITNARLGRRYMLAARRDHGQHDRPDASDRGEMERDIANLRRDDAKLEPIARRLGLPDWTDWWPTLEELREGAKAMRGTDLTQVVTLVVHTGGEPDRWPERQGYLRKSLESLTQRVVGNVAQRVIYSDWGDAAPELAEIAAEYGFYVAGDGHHGYTASMQRLWRYLARRATGDYIFMAEDDFLYEQDVDLSALATILDERPNVTQVALLRAPAYQSELDKGGILGWPTDSFREAGSNGYRWLEHRNFWTANPSLFRKSLTQRAWPNGTSSERLFADDLFRDTRAVAAFWGTGQAQIRHIGEVRAGTGY